MKWLLIILGFVCSQFSDFTVIKAVSLINQERERMNISPMIIDWQMITALNRFINIGGNAWMFQDCNNASKPNGYGHILNFNCLGQNRNFQFSTNFFIDNAHDTFAPGREINLVSYRLKQGRVCYSGNNCKSTFDNFRTCTFYDLNTTCKNFFMYYPRFIHKAYKYIAFVDLRIVGRFVKKKVQTNSWAFFFLGTEPTSDLND